jgi:class 3 adenylate cyclase
MTTGGAPSVVTFLFTDLVGSTELTDSLGDEGAQEILRIHNAVVRTEVGRHAGSEVKTMGDGFMIAFRGPTSALACAVAIQRAIAQHNHEQPAREFMVRMGLNAGEAIQEEADFFGAAVIVAARIAALADGGEILTSEAVKQLGQGTRGIEYEFKGEFQLKGLREPHRVYQVVSGPAGRPAVAALRRPRFVGREEELEELKASLESVLAGAGKFILLGGEPGIGKTRLAEELARHARRRGFRVFRGRCYETEAASPYVTFVEILRDYLRGRPDDALLDELGDDAAEMAKLVPELRRRIPIRDDSARLPPEQERYRLLETVRRWLEGLAHQRAVLLLIEDLHWADSASCLLLRHLAPSLMSAPILVLATCKEENLQSLDRLSGALAEFGRLQLYRHMTLGGLAGAAFKEILSGMGSGEPPAELAEAIHEQTGGNPFFVTELVNHLDAEGKLFGPDGDWRQALSEGEWEIPESVRVVIQRRLSSLSEETRKVLTVAAAVGKEFSYETLEAVGEVSSEELLDVLEEGIRMGVIEETEGAATRFRFTRQFTRQTLLYVGSENPPRG